MDKKEIIKIEYAWTSPKIHDAMKGIPEGLVITARAGDKYSAMIIIKEELERMIKENEHKL